jgi:phosphate transport system protein
VTLDTRRQFHQQLGDVRRDMLRLAATVCEAIPRGTEALLDSDVDAAQAIIDADDELDDLSALIEDRCYHQLALQQPMAGDLRVLIGSMRITAELERTGDLVVNIAKAVQRITGQPIDARLRGLLQRMSDEAHNLLVRAVGAYIDGNAAAATDLDRLDDGLDAVHRHYIARVLDTCRDGIIEIHVAVQLALIGRFYERIGDHAVNIGQRVAFMVTGDVPRRSELTPIPTPAPPNEVS